MKKAHTPKAAPSTTTRTGKKADEKVKSHPAPHPQPSTSRSNVKADAARKGSVSHKSDTSRGGSTTKHDAAKKVPVSKPAASRKSDASHGVSAPKFVYLKSTSDTDSSEPLFSERSDTQSVGDAPMVSGHDSRLIHREFAMCDASFIDNDSVSHIGEVCKLNRIPGENRTVGD